ncbi:MAG TPA: RNA polymerase factor sigma-54 [Burkholderiaceae bacterium]|nr:RNA polymerase factor sigma-54 [Burkholderiaceae bacterium]
MKPSLQLKLSQHLALTPQLQQSIRLLQLSTLELNQEIEQALADNPLLEREDDPLAGSPRITADGAIINGSGNNTGATDPGRSEGETAGDEAEAPVAIDGDGLTDWGHGSSGAERDDEDSGPQSWASTRPTLHEHLRAQLSVTAASPRDRALVELLIAALDDDGYLTSALDDLLALCPTEEQVDGDDLAAALSLLQSFDPPGVGARSAAECLAIQITSRLRQNPDEAEQQALKLAHRIVSDYLPLLAARDYAKLRKHLECTDDELRVAHQLIRGLNPHPGVGFGSSAAEYVVPDIFVRRVRNRWVAQLNAEVMPRLRVNQAYAAIVKRDKGSEGHAPWSQRLQEARWLIRNIQQRFDTILRVSQAIVDRQHNFFSHGEIAMRPLVLREIADTVNLHESTISRVTSSKYMATPFGVFELKYFFGSHVATDSGGAASSTAIRALIKQLVSAEDARNPLSDSRIAELLGEQGIVVARRTVAKYRESLKIAPVAMRKTL